MKTISILLSCLLLLVSISQASDQRLEDTSELFSVEIEGLWGFIDAQGRITIKPVFDSVGFFSEGLASARTNGKWGFIDTKGEMVIPPQFNYADCFSEGLAVVSQGEEVGFIDRTGRWAIPARFQSAGGFSEGLARVETLGRWKFIDKTGGFVGSGEYEDAFDFNEGLAAVQYADKWGFIDCDGNYIIQPRLDDAYEFSEGWAPVSIDGESNFINKQGGMMTDGTVFLSTQVFSEGLAVAQSMRNGKNGYVDRRGKFVIPADYDIVFLFREGLAAVSRSGRYGFIDKNGTEVIPLQYDFTEVFIGGLARVKSGEEWLYIDRKGRTVWPKSGSSEASPDLANVFIHYDNAGLILVVIKDGMLKYISSQYKGANPVSAGGPDDYLRSGTERKVTGEEIDSLIRLFKTSGFLDLKDVYGTTPEDRHYPIRITIKTPEIDKTVLYRSHPDYQAPPAFQQMEAALLKLAKGTINRF